LTQLGTCKPGFNATECAFRRTALQRWPAVERSDFAPQPTLRSAASCGIAPQNCHDCHLCLFLIPQ
jgi:hypothetical protein